MIGEILTYGRLTFHIYPTDLSYPSNNIWNITSNNRLQHILKYQQVRNTRKYCSINHRMVGGGKELSRLSSPIPTPFLVLVQAGSTTASCPGLHLITS